jgi:hypothetical protein
MTTLRQRMTEDMRIRNLALNTQTCYYFGGWLKALALLLSIWILLPMLSLLPGAFPFLRGHAEEAAPVALAR